MWGRALLVRFSPFDFGVICTLFRVLLCNRECCEGNRLASLTSLVYPAAYPVRFVLVIVFVYIMLSKTMRPSSFSRENL